MIPQFCAQVPTLPLPFKKWTGECILQLDESFFCSCCDGHFARERSPLRLVPTTDIDEVAPKKNRTCVSPSEICFFFSFAKETSAENKLAGPASVAQSRLVPRQLPRETFRLCIERSEEPKKTWNQLSQCLHKRLLLFHLSFVSVSLCMRGKDSGNLQRQPTTSATPPKRRSSEENVKKDVL